ncbi:histidine kinase [Vibrio sp. 10N.286.49.B3]|uniref:alpha/beta fold hydrolase n=1 Tax=Vibrio sp. 10N.286.49.B3 TaxID=1880855 RepID=UPI000C846B2F|nr:alpha/beta fold hydrolase [Vibrio sp. 10N.286.49.B3]PMH46847.1 histidine kinase [Vibrio sp. 10N.286.49.B3]
MSVQLNYKLEGEGHTIVLIHGLFGNLDNLGLLARDLCQDHQVLSVDLRNHGKSFHSDQHNYQLMAEDVISLIKDLNLSSVSVIGHSMGGKVAMKMVDISPQQIKDLIVLDMSPVPYYENRHANVFLGLQKVINSKPTTRLEALTLLSEEIKIEGVRQFLSKSLKRSDDNVMSWHFNVAALYNQYDQIMNWQTIEQTSTPTLFIKGGDSDYLLPEHQSAIQAQFSHAKAHIIARTGHWLHAEKPKEVLRVIRKFLQG